MWSDRLIAAPKYICVVNLNLLEVIQGANGLIEQYKNIYLSQIIFL